MKKFNKKPLASFLGYLLVTSSSLAMNSEDGRDVNNKYANYRPSHFNVAYLAKHDSFTQIPEEDSSSESSSTSSSDSAEELLPTLPSGPGDLYSLPYNKILNSLAKWPGDVTGAVDCWMTRTGSSEFSWVPGTMTIQRHQILWTPASKSMNTDAIAGPILEQPLYAPRSFSHARRVRAESETEFTLLGKHTGNGLKESRNIKESRKGSLKESRKGSQLGDRFRASGSLEPWIEAINKYITQVSDWEKLYQLGADFTSKATTFGRMIIEEYHLPDSKKAIKKSSLGGVAGGDKFIIHDILFKFSIDPEISSNRWLYGGNKANDTKAFKSFNHELLGANAVSSYGVWLKTPLMALIDFRGRRLMATSLIPIKDDTLVYGSKDGAKTVFATDPFANEKMTQMGKDFNLQPHMVTNKLMALCGDLEIHHSWGDYYALDLARIFPPEDPSIQNHPPVSVFYQKLNPVFVKAYKIPLDADGLTAFQDESNEDTKINNANLTLATQYLYNEVLPCFVKKLMTLPIPEFLLEKEKKSRTGYDKEGDFLIRHLHEAGLNVRHLGRIWEALEEAHKKSLTEKSCPQKSLTSTSLAKGSIDLEKIRAMSDYVLNVMITRVLKNHVHTVFREEMAQESEYRHFITDIINNLSQVPLNTQEFWGAQMPKLLKDQFGIEIQDLRDRLHQGYLLTTVCRLMGVGVRNHPIYEKAMSFEFAPSDIDDFKPVIKYLNMIDLATGMNHYFKGMALMPTAKNTWTFSKVSRAGLDHLIEAKDKLTICRLTWNNQNHEVLPYHLDKLINTLQDLIQEYKPYVGVEASLQDNRLQTMISGDGTIDAVNLRDFWTSGSKKFTKIKVIGTIEKFYLSEIMKLPTNLTYVDVSHCYGITEGEKKFVQWFNLRTTELPHIVSSDEDAKHTPPTLLNLSKCEICSNGVQVLMLVVPQNNNITSLNLRNNLLGPEGAITLSTGNLTNLTSLNLIWNVVGNDGAKALSTGNLTNLTSLDLSWNGVGNEGVKALLTGNLTNLTSLDLSNSTIRDVGEQALSTGNLSNLRSLNLSHNSINAKGAKAFSTGNFSNLRSLDLSNNIKLKAEGAQALSTGNLTNLTWLHLAGTCIGAEGTKALSTGNLTNLTSLNLESNLIEVEGAKALSTGNLTNLTELNVDNNFIRADGAKALSTGNLTNLTSLNLYHNRIGAEGTKALSTGNLTNLTCLLLSRNKIGDEGAKALSTGNLTNLTSLCLARNHLMAEGAKALSSGNLTALIKLNLQYNFIRAEGAKALSTGNLSNLRSLYLVLTFIEAEGAKALSTGNLTGLTSLNLSDTNVGDEGAKALATGNFSDLKTLSLSRNKIGDEGAKALSTGNPTSLTLLDLSGNYIRDEGAKALSTGNLTNLTSLTLYSNKIKDEGKAAFANKRASLNVTF